MRAPSILIEEIEVVLFLRRATVVATIQYLWEKLLENMTTTMAGVIQVYGSVHSIN